MHDHITFYLKNATKNKEPRFHDPLQVLEAGENYGLFTEEKEELSDKVVSKDFVFAMNRRGEELLVHKLMPCLVELIPKTTTAPRTCVKAVVGISKEVVIATEPSKSQAEEDDFIAKLMKNAVTVKAGQENAVSVPQVVEGDVVRPIGLQVFQEPRIGNKCGRKQNINKNIKYIT